MIHIPFPDHQQNSRTFPDQINSLTFQVSGDPVSEHMHQNKSSVMICKSCQCILHHVSKKLCKFAFIRTSSNFHQFWWFL